MERTARERQQQQAGQQQAPRVPLFRNRAFGPQRTALAAAESIEDADSGDEEGPEAAGPPPPRPVPQLGRRGALPLAAGAGDAVAGGAADKQRGRAEPAAVAGSSSGALLIDFLATDVDALRPSVLLK